MFVYINDNPKLWWQYETRVFVMFLRKWPPGKYIQGFISLDKTI